MALTDEEIRRWVAASCQDQGVPLTVTDPSTVRQVAVLLTGRAASQPAERARGRQGRLQPPDGRDSIGIDGGAAFPVGCPLDDGVVEDC